MVENEIMSVDYNLTSSTGPFAIPFYFIENAHIVAQLFTLNSAGDYDETTLTLDTDYYLTGAGSTAGGTLTLTAAHSGSILYILRDPDATQKTSYQATGKFPATSHERALDKLTMLIQRFGWWWDNLALKKPNIFAKYYDAKNNRIANLANPVNAQDAATKSYVDAGDASNNQHADDLFKRTLRFPDRVDQMPGPDIRGHSLQGYNDRGRPVPVFSMTDTADLALKLASSGGGRLLGLAQGGTVQDADYYLTPEIYGDANEFGTAMVAAIAASNNAGGAVVEVPAGDYILDKTIEATLTAHLTIKLTAGTRILVDSPIDCFSITLGNYSLTIQGNGGAIASNWSETDSNTAAAIRVNGSTLKRSFICSNLTIQRADDATGSYFGYGVHGSALNAPFILAPSINADTAIFLESASGSGASDHAMGAVIASPEINGAKYGVVINNQGGLGCEGLHISGGQIVADYGITINNSGLNSSAYLPPLFRIENVHINSYRSIYAKDVMRLFITSCDMQSRHSVDNAANGVIEIGGCQGVVIGSCVFSSSAVNGAGNSYKKPPLYQFASTLTNAYVKFADNIVWLDGMTAPVLGFAGTDNVSVVSYRDNTLQSSGSIVLSDYRAYINADADTTIGNTGAAAGMGYSSSATLADGVLSLGSAPSMGSVYALGIGTVPSASTIGQITFPSRLVGRVVQLMFSGSEITFTNGTNLTCPDSLTFKMWRPNVVTVYVYNTVQCRILGVGGMQSNTHQFSAAPASTTSTGYAGAEFYDSTNGRFYKYFPGYGWRYISTNAID